jgi:hypothetical protein
MRTVPSACENVVIRCTTANRAPASRSTSLARATSAAAAASSRGE